MNFAELKTAALSDAHREGYTTHINRFTAEAEAFIFARLEAYGLEYTLTDTDRVVAAQSVYNLPSKFISVRQIFFDKLPLDPVDESFIYNQRDSTRIIAYAVRPRTVIFAGNPSTGATLPLHYWGMPAALVQDTDTNTLLNDWPQLYKRAIHISVYQRAENFQAKQDAQSDVIDLITQINRKVKKQMAGSRSSNPYNVFWRSSY